LVRKKEKNDPTTLILNAKMCMIGTGLKAAREGMIAFHPSNITPYKFVVDESSQMMLTRLIWGL
jgi:hypothetical protein